MQSPTNGHKCCDNSTICYQTWDNISPVVRQVKIYKIMVSLLKKYLVFMWRLEVVFGAFSITHEQTGPSTTQYLR